jgi:hypothetical protein
MSTAASGSYATGRISRIFERYGIQGKLPHQEEPADEN